MSKDIIIFLIWLAIIPGVIIGKKIAGKRKQRVKNEYSEQEHQYFRGRRIDDEFLC